MEQGSKVLFLIVSMNRYCPCSLLGVEPFSNLAYKSRFRDFHLMLPRRRNVTVINLFRISIFEYLSAFGKRMSTLFKTSEISV
jgi:hypothetical protein